MTVSTFASRPILAVPPRRGGLALSDGYLRLHLGVLLGYALAGKGFAYLGVGPVYVGELALGVGLVVAVATGAILRIPRSATLYWMVGLFVWCGARTVQGLGDHGMNALRDSVIWSYAGFALIIAGFIVSRPDRLGWLMARYRGFGRFFILAVPLLWLVTTGLGEALPKVVGAPAEALEPKWSDTLVHLAGIASFQLVGLAPSSLTSLLSLGFGFIVFSSGSRGAMIAFVAAVGLVGLVRPLRRRLWMAVALIFLALPLLLTVELGAGTTGRRRSVQQLVENTLSIFQPQSASGLDGTKQWRLDWWSEITDYTFFGPYFWSGRGFGPNLAQTDGFTLDLEVPLRSPHNCHLTFLARGGVPALVLWAGVQLSWLLEMARRYRLSRKRGEARWAQLFLFLMAYWLAFLLNASFDVALEGPMAGVWFWSLFGVGLAAAHLHKQRPRAAKPRVRVPAVHELRPAD